MIIFEYINDDSGLHRMFAFSFFLLRCINKECLREEGNTKTQTERMIVTLSAACVVLSHTSVMTEKEVSISR